MSLPPMVQATEPEPRLTDDIVERYPWIPAWGMLCRFPPNVVREQLRLAVEQDAPPTALSRFHDDQRWVCLADITTDAYETRLWLLDYAYSRDMTIPYEVLKVWLDPNVIRPLLTLEWNPWDRS